MSDDKIEVGKDEIKDMLVSRIRQSPHVELGDLELHLLSNFLFALVTSSDGLAKDVSPSSLSFDPKLRVRVEERLLDILIAITIGVITGSAIESIGSAPGGIAACSAYLINCIPELRKWACKYWNITDSKERLILNFIKVASPISRDKIFDYTITLEISNEECGRIIGHLLKDGLLCEVNGEVQMALSDEAASITRNTDLDVGQKKSSDHPDLGV